LLSEKFSEFFTIEFLPIRSPIFPKLRLMDVKTVLLTPSIDEVMNVSIGTEQKSL